MTGFTSTGAGVTEVGQSFTMPDCTDEFITSIEIYSLNTHTEAILRIYMGEGLSGSLLREQTNVDITGVVNFGAATVITLANSLPFTTGQVFTFELDFPTGNASTFQLAKTTINAYPGGNLYENSSAISGEDLRFTVNTSPTSLPVELSFFNARINGGQTLLTWQTASEQNNDGFEIERSADGRDWEMIGFEEGNGTTTEVHEYFFYDEKPMLGENYYRLRQVDFDGQFDYSMVKVVQFNNGEAAGGPTVAPNPARAGQTLTVSNAVRDAIEIRLLDLNGRLLKALPLTEAEASVFDLPADLQKGIYFLVFYSKNGRTAQRIVVQ